MKIFLEPADWDKELHEPKPVIQLNVSTKSYIGETATSGPTAVERSKLPCMYHRPNNFSTLPQLITCDIGTVLWSISKSAFDPRIIRGILADVHKRASYPLFLPAGVNIEEMEKVWHDMQFNPAAPVDVPFKTELFRPAPRSVQVLRRLSRKGQNDLDRAVREQEGRDKLVLGLPNDAREMVPLLARAHGDLGSGPLSGPGVGEGSARPDGSTITPGLPAEPQYFEGAREQATSSVMNAAAEQEQEWARGDAVPSTMTSRIVGPDTVDVGEQAGQIFQTVPLPGTNAGCSDFVSESTVVHLEEMLSEDQRRIVGDTDDGQLTAVRSRPAHHIFSRSAERNSKSLRLIEDLKRDLRNADKID